MIEREDHGPVTLLRMAHGKANALDTEFCRALAGALRAFERSDARAAVLTGSGSIFCAGVDLKRIVDGGAAYVDEFLPALDELLRALAFCPKPIVGACNGHAIAGGLVILCACDVRLVANGKGRLGVPELLVGVPFPRLALELVRAVVPSPAFARVVYEGKAYGVEEALARGLGDEALAPDALLEEALATARRLAEVPPASFRATKELGRRPLRESVEDDAASERAIRGVWKKPETLEAVRAFVARTL